MVQVGPNSMQAERKELGFFQHFQRSGQGSGFFIAGIFLHFFRQITAAVAHGYRPYFIDTFFLGDLLAESIEVNEDRSFAQTLGQQGKDKYAAGNCPHAAKVIRIAE